ncbi:MAG: NHLP bacteriocin system secretion protein [Bacillota bacterium]|nr:NHLP bacteriocin system secretion protein [Bacillota bacterium]
MSQSIFREVPLERLSSPEQLDELIKVTSPRAWFALIALVSILITVVTWSFLGTIPSKIDGHGILLHNGGVFSLQHHASGQVIDVRYKHGDLVKKGDVIARIEIPGLVSEINSLLITLDQIKNNQSVDSPEYKLMENQVIKLQEELIYQSQIVSQIDGRILELDIQKGNIIQPGEPLATLEQYGNTVKLEAIIYVPAEQGGIIMPGMEAQVSPTIVNKEEYGFMMGRVISVSEYPATTKSIMQTLENENLATFLAGKGASLMVKIDLIPDRNTASGYRWSTPEGPPISIHSGTIIQSAVITNSEKPISKALPFLKGVVR